MSEPRIVKRYANRKLYDTQTSHYVTLDQIADMIRAGEEVRVLDNNSKEDLTSVTLAQIIFEEEKRQKSFIPLTAMRQIIQSGGASLTELAQQAGARVTSLFRKADEDEAAEPQPVEAEARDADDGRDGGGGVRELLERSHQTIEEWQRRMDERVRSLVEAVSPFAALEKEVARLRERLDELEARLDAAGAQAGKGEE